MQVGRKWLDPRRGPRAVLVREPLRAWAERLGKSSGCTWNRAGVWWPLENEAKGRANAGGARRMHERGKDDSDRRG